MSEKGNRAPERTKDGGTGMSREEGGARLKKAKDELPHGEGGIHNPSKDTDFRQLGTSTRPLHKQLSGAGKGDDARPLGVDAQTYAENYCRTFGHNFKRGWPRCLSCGTKKGKR